MPRIWRPFPGERNYRSPGPSAWAPTSTTFGAGIELRPGKFHVPAFTGKIRNVLACIYKGLDTKGTAQAMFVSVNTIKYHLKNLYEKLDAHNRAELLFRLKQMMEA